MRARRSLILYIMLFIIQIYQWVISPLIGSHCRFHPSCSSYAAEALRHYGVRKGFLLSIKRLIRCHPWNQGGEDPLPKDLNMRGQRGPFDDSTDQ
ncbi:MAG: membrane protein insertion efficiency factor YidD [Chlamydiota bacterium]|nr:membrane protein insertion efficiency factor YidD [Chlamydiota bacterium]